MTKHSSTPAVTISSPEALIASIPYLVGFLPLESLIAVFISSPPRTVVVTMRLDLPPEGDLQPAVDALSNAIERARSRADIDLVHLVVWCEQPDGDLARQLVRGLTPVCTGLGVSVGQGLATDGDRWVGLDATGRRGGPVAEGGKVSADSQALLAQCQLVGAGFAYLPTRDHLSAALAPAADPLPIEAIEGALESKVDAELGGSGCAWRRRSEDQLVAWLTSDREPERVPIRAARWCAALSDSRVREPVMHRILVGREPDSLRTVRGRLALLVRKAPLEVVAPVAAVLAACAWQDGDGAAALVAAERALVAEPDNCLARLIQASAGSGLPPGQWVRILQTFGLERLRSGAAPEDDLKVVGA